MEGGACEDVFNVRKRELGRAKFQERAGIEHIRADGFRQCQEEESRQDGGCFVE